MTDAIGGATGYTYDAAGNILTVTDPAGGVTSYEHDALNRATEVIDPNGGAQSLAYDETGNLTKAADAEGNEITYAYDALDRLISYTDPEGNTFVRGYDANGNKIQEIDARGNSILYEYDALNRLTQITDQLGGVTSREYDNDGRMIKTVGPEGAETVYEYDAAGRVTKIQDALGNETIFEYDAMDRVITVTDANGASTTYTYTPAGKTETITYPDGGVTHYTYSAAGKVLTETNPNNETVSYAYDALGRPVSVTDPLGNTDSFEYNANGKITAVTDKNGNTTNYAHDGNGNIVETTDALGQISEFVYDMANRLTQVQLYRTDGQGAAAEQEITVYEYDGRGLVTKIINADDTSKVYVYDQNGNLESITDEDGGVTEYAYDARNLAQSISYAGGKNVSFAYNAAGRLIQMTDWLGTTYFSLDLLGRIQAVNDHNGNTTGYEYDPAGNRTKVQYPDDSAVVYNYDALNRLTGVTDAGGNAASYNYDLAGRLISLTNPDGSEENYVMDAAGRVIAVTDGSDVQIKAYAYDPRGNLIEEIRNLPGTGESNTINYSYDALNRLAGVTESGANADREYEYDSLGNMLREARGNNITEYTYNNRNQLAEKVIDGGERRVYTFDTCGNLVLEEMQPAAGAPLETAASYEYDGMNKMVGGTNAGGVSSGYIYNGLGRLAGKDTPDVKQYVLDYPARIPGPLTENDVKYVYGLERISQASGGVARVYHNDRLGSAEKLTDLDGNVTARVEYDEWGKPSVITPGLNPNYTGHEYDQALGVYYAKARFYDPRVLRMLAEDTVKGNVRNPQSFNLYAYVQNNPVNYVDLLGLRGENPQLLASYGRYKIGAPVELDYYFWGNEDFVYDPNAVITDADKESWKNYGNLIAKAQAFNIAPKWIREKMIWVVGDIFGNSEDAEKAKKRLNSDLSDALETQCQIVKLVDNRQKRNFADYFVLRFIYNQTKYCLTQIEYIAKSLFWSYITSLPI